MRRTAQIDDKGEKAPGAALALADSGARQSAGLAAAFAFRDYGKKSAHGQHVGHWVVIVKCGPR